MSLFSDNSQLLPVVACCVGCEELIGESLSPRLLQFQFDRLSLFRLAEEGDLTLALVDERINALRTTAYSFRNFQHPPIILTGTGSSTGVEANGNGRFDLLNVGVGSYRFSFTVMVRQRHVLHEFLQLNH